MAVFMINVYTNELDIIKKFELLDESTNESIVVTKEALYSAIELGRIRVENIRASNNRITGYGSAIKNYRTIVENAYTYGSYINDDSIVIIGEDKKNGLYRVVIARTKEIKILSKEELLGLVNRRYNTLANGRVYYDKYTSGYEIDGKFKQFESVDSTDIRKYKQKAKILGSDILRLITYENDVEVSINQRYKNNKADIVIPKGATRLIEYAFARGEFKSVIIPDTVNYIGTSAFYSTVIDELVIRVNDKLTVESNAFTLCKVNRLVIETNSDRLPDSLLMGIRVNHELVLPDTVRDMGENQSITLADNDLSKYKLKVIRRNTFELHGTNNLKLPNVLERIENGAIRGRLKLEVFEIPEHIKYIGSRGLGLKFNRLLVNHKLELDESAFNGCGIKELIINAPLDAIRDSVFYGNEFEYVEINSDIPVIDNYAFSHYDDNKFYKVKMVGLPKKMGRCAFRNAHFGTMMLDKEMESKRRIFNRCVFDRLYIDATLDCYNKRMLSGCFIGSFVLKSNGMVGRRLIGDSKISALKIMGDVESISSEAFQKTMLKKLILNDSLKRIGDRAFLDCELQEVIIPTSVNYIGISAFAFNKITKVTIKQDDIYLDNGAFYGNNIDSIKLSKKADYTETSFDKFTKIVH